MDGFSFDFSFIEERKVKFVHLYEFEIRYMQLNLKTMKNEK